MNEHPRRMRLATGLAACLMMVGAGKAGAQTTGIPELDCVIEPQQIVKLSTPVIGVIGRIDVDRGDVIKKGQVLGKLEDGVEQANLNLSRAKATNEYATKAVEARLDFLRRKNARAGQLVAKNAGSQAALEEADSDVSVAEQQLKQAELELELARLDVGLKEEELKQRTLVSPIDGVVTERLLVPGEFRNEQSPILTLAQIDPLRVEVFVPTSQYGRIRVGSQAKILPQQPIGGSYAATVTVADQVLDAASGTFGVRLALPNPGLRLPAGIRCKVQFESPGPASPQAPTSRLETTPAR
ncbi:MAG TPA: efflux RND transporter periplasmic adaptor subunit [Xanthobacteraceae bacterium]|nr:efflux RND transporter periplasmic adaptor subunit [Xanthobacteraceae bacterium]